MVLFGSLWFLIVLIDCLFLDFLMVFGGSRLLLVVLGNKLSFLVIFCVFSFVILMALGGSL